MTTPLNSEAEYDAAGHRDSAMRKQEFERLRSVQAAR